MPVADHARAEHARVHATLRARAHAHVRARVHAIVLLPIAFTLAPPAEAAAVALSINLAQSAPPSSAADEPIHLETLPNGVTLVLEERPGCGTFAIEATTLSGSLEDPDDLLGLTSILARMLLRGSASLPAAEQARRIERTGSSLDSVGRVAGVGLSASGPSPAFSGAFDVLADAALHPLLAEADLQKEISLARQSLRTSMDSGSAALTRAALPLVYGSHPLGRVSRDPKIYLEGARLDAVRRAYAERFVGRRILVVIVGAVDGAAARERVLATFGALPEGAPPAPPPPAPQPIKDEIRKHEHRRTSQPEIVVAMPTSGVADEDAPAMDILAYILGGFQERLSSEIREKRGWAYWLGAWDARYRGAGVFGIRTAVPRRHLAETERIIKEALSTIAATPPTADEVDRARNYAVTTLARSWQLSSARAERFTMALVQGRPVRSYAEIVPKYERVTPGMVQALARRLLDSSKLAVVTLY